MALTLDIAQIPASQNLLDILNRKTHSPLVSCEPSYLDLKLTLTPKEIGSTDQRPSSLIHLAISPRYEKTCKRYNIRVSLEVKVRDRQ